MQIFEKEYLHFFSHILKLKFYLTGA
jgi:hypothetical protein